MFDHTFGSNALEQAIKVSDSSPISIKSFMNTFIIANVERIIILPCGGVATNSKVSEFGMSEFPIVPTYLDCVQH